MVKSTGTSTVRASCDMCSFAKVKCNRERPVCSRCSAKSLPCNYAVSRRKGRSQQSRSSSDPTVLGVSAKSPLSEASTSHPGLYRTMTNESTSISDFNTGNGAQPISNPGTDRVDHEMSNGFEDFPFPADPSAIDWDDFMSDINVLNGAPSQAWPTANVASDMVGPMKGTPTATTVEHRTSPRPDPAPTSSIIKTNNASQINDNNRANRLMDTLDSHGSHETDCLGTVINIIASLHVPKPTCGSHQSSGTAQIPSVDVVLARNKQVVQTLERMMYCNCSLDRQLGPLIGIAISKLLNWYAAAAKTDTSQSGSSPAAAFQPGSHEHASGLPITLGSYQMEDLDISIVRILLVTREAEARIGPLLNLFERRFCAADGPEKTMSRYSIPITRYTEGLLREKLKHLIQEASLSSSSTSKAKKTTMAPS